MTREALEQLRPKLQVLERVKGPDLPAHVAFQECQDLLTFIDKDPEVRAEIDSVGLPSDHLPSLALALAAARQAQSDWAAVRSPRKPEEQAQLEAEGRSLRSEAAAACRFTLRADRLAQGAVDRIMEGDSIPDLVQDLEDLASLVEQHLDRFAHNRKFDAPCKVPVLRSKAQEIRLGLATFRTADAKREALDLRNRAWTHFDHLLTELRQAGQYAFLGTPMVREFQSEYNRRKRQARKRQD
jgi:hypothetical protein